ncbi:Protein of unknown function [Gryllus bimaculatus]|nr:Protein of unknown function [Gryllus bimaculatus]
MLRKSDTVGPRKPRTPLAKGRCDCLPRGEEKVVKYQPAIPLAAQLHQRRNPASGGNPGDLKIPSAVFGAFPMGAHAAGRRAYRGSPLQPPGPEAKGESPALSQPPARQAGSLRQPGDSRAVHSPSQHVTLLRPGNSPSKLGTKLEVLTTGCASVAGYSCRGAFFCIKRVCLQRATVMVPTALYGSSRALVWTAAGPPIPRGDSVEGREPVACSTGGPTLGAAVTADVAKTNTRHSLESELHLCYLLSENIPRGPFMCFRLGKGPVRLSHASGGGGGGARAAAGGGGAAAAAAGGGRRRRGGGAGRDARQTDALRAAVARTLTAAPLSPMQRGRHTSRRAKYKQRGAAFRPTVSAAGCNELITAIHKSRYAARKERKL